MCVVLKAKPNKIQHNMPFFWYQCFLFVCLFGQVLYNYKETSRSTRPMLDFALKHMTGRTQMLRKMPDPFCRNHQSLSPEKKTYSIFTHKAKAMIIIYLLG